LWLLAAKACVSTTVRKIRDLIHEHVKNLLRNDCAGCCSGLVDADSTPQTINE